MKTETFSHLLALGLGNVKTTFNFPEFTLHIFGGEHLVFTVSGLVI